MFVGTCEVPAYVFDLKSPINNFPGDSIFFDIFDRTDENGFSNLKCNHRLTVKINLGMF